MASTGIEKNFKVIPENLQDITASWLQTALQKGGTIGKDTKVMTVEVKPIIDEASGFEDGGGLSGSNLVRLIPTYGGKSSGDEPSSLVCKVSGNNKRNMGFIWRFLIFTTNQGSLEDQMNRQEPLFYQQIIPHLNGTPFKCPKVYFIGLEDNGNNTLLSMWFCTSQRK